MALLAAAPAPAAELPIIDAHIHYSADAWEMLPPAEAVRLLREAGVMRALVSSSGDDGTQKLHAEAPDLIVPELRPYRSRGEISSWVRDESIIPHLEGRLGRFRYVGIGEFHVYGADADLPVVRRAVELARQHRLFLHAHSDADAVDRLFRQDPDARVLWAHAGFAGPADVRAALGRHANLWADLAFRSDHAPGGRLDPEWRSLLEAFPDRFMLGTDTFAPERWHYVGRHATWSRTWLAELPLPLAERIAWRNADALFGAFPAAAAAECGAELGAAGVRRIERPGYTLAYQPEPAEIAPAQLFSLKVAVCSRGRAPAPALVRVDAWMPEHGHAMNYATVLTGDGEGNWRVDGLMFHMPGRWEITFDLGVGRPGTARTERLTAEEAVE